MEILQYFCVKGSKNCKSQNKENKKKKKKHAEHTLTGDREKKLLNENWIV